MDLQLAIALSSTKTGCELRLLSDRRSFRAKLADPMIEHGITVKPGDLAVVGQQGDSQEIVFRLSLVKVNRIEDERVLVDGPPGNVVSMEVVKGLHENIVPGDMVFAASGLVYDVARNGSPASPEHLQRVLIPQIEAMYRQIEVWNNLDPKKVVEEGYDQIAERYLEWLQTARLEERDRYTSVLLEQLLPGACVLDLGCGSGVPTTRLLADKFRVVGVDISRHQIDLARLYVPGAQFIQADATQLDLPASSFDGVLAFYSLIHIPRQEQKMLLQNVASWLRPGGLFVATMSTAALERDFGEDYLGTRMFWSGFDGETNRQLVEGAGLRIVSACEETAPEFGMPITFLWVIAKKPNVVSS